MSSDQNFSSTDVTGDSSTLVFSRLDLLIIGSIFVLICIFCIVPYILTIWIFITKKQFNQHFAYHIMVNLGIFEILEVFTYMIQGVMMIANSNFGYVISILVGGLNNAAWFGNIILTLVLAIDRFDALIYPTFTGSLPIYKQKIYKALLLLTYIIIILNFFFFMIPGFRIQLNITSYDPEKLAADINIYFITTIIALCLLGIACVLYLIALVMLFVKRHMIQSQTSLVSSHEIRLFIQTIIICGYKSIITILWTFYFPPTPLAYGLSFSAAILESGYNPYLYFVVNRTFRRQLLNIILKKYTPEIAAVNVIPRQRNSKEHSRSISIRATNF